MAKQNKPSLGTTIRQNSSGVLAALMCIVIGLVIGLIALFIINPEHALVDGFWRILQGGFYDFPYGCGKVLTQTAPLIMTGLSVAFAFKTGLPSCLPRSRPAPAPSAPPRPKRWTIINSNV